MVTLSRRPRSNAYEAGSASGWRLRAGSSRVRGKLFWQAKPLVCGCAQFPVVPQLQAQPGSRADQKTALYSEGAGRCDHVRLNS